MHDSGDGLAETVGKGLSHCVAEAGITSCGHACTTVKVRSREGGLLQEVRSANNSWISSLLALFPRGWPCETGQLATRDVGAIKLGPTISPITSRHPSAIGHQSQYLIHWGRASAVQHQCLACAHSSISHRHRHPPLYVLCGGVLIASPRRRHMQAF